MRVCSIVVLVVVGPSLALGARQAKDDLNDRIARLIERLGSARYADREAAARDLESIGQPAVDPLRSAAAASHDPEVQARAQRVIGAIAARAGERELAKLAGYWKTADGAWLEINGDRWSSGTPTWGPARGRIWVVDVGKSLVAADMFVEEGPNRGLTCLAIYWREGDRLRYCGTYTAVRAKDFKAPAGYYAAEFNRGKK